MEQNKVDRANEEQRNREAGHPGDVDFQRMIQRYRDEMASAQQHFCPDEPIKICIAVRKRPISSKEVKRHDHDSVTCSHPVVTVHDCKLRVDGISKYLDNVSFQFDHTFGEADSTDDIYLTCVQPLIPFITGKTAGRATVFAYGQTGSGKTFTMMGVQRFIAEDLFASLDAGAALEVFVSFFEIYGGRCQDLLNERSRLNIREDGGGEVVVGDLVELQVSDAAEMLSVIETGNANRTTHATESNDVSSRSHAICQVSLRTAAGKLAGKLSLIDLAGSERGADTVSNNRQRRLEGAEINKSLLALKECIRALDSNSSHVSAAPSPLTDDDDDDICCVGALSRLEADSGAEGRLHACVCQDCDDRVCVSRRVLRRPHHQHASLRRPHQGAHCRQSAATATASVSAPGSRQGSSFLRRPAGPGETGPRRAAHSAEQDAGERD